MQPRFEPQRVARAEADRLHRGMGEQFAGECFGVRGRDRDLEAIFAGVTGARREVFAERAGAHEGKACRIGKRLLGRRALKRDERMIEQLEAQPGADFAQQRGVVLLPRRVDDDAYLVGEPGPVSAFVEEGGALPLTARVEDGGYAVAEPRHLEAVPDTAVLVKENGGI